MIAAAGTAGSAGADARLEALVASVARLRAAVEGLSDDVLTTSAYPREWSIADVLSHLGSGAVITQRRLEDTVDGRQTPDDHAPSVWDEWNAKTPAEQRRDALATDAELVARLQQVPGETRESIAFPMGPMQLDFADFVAMRLNEHAFHTWDVEVVADDRATLPRQSAEVVIDNLELVARFTARPTGNTRQVNVATTDPERAFVIELAEDSATLRPSNDTTSDDRTRADLVLPAEAFARLIYGHLDAAHTPTPDSDLLDELRTVFPGP